MSSECKKETKPQAQFRKPSGIILASTGIMMPRTWRPKAANQNLRNKRPRPRTANRNMPKRSYARACPPTPSALRAYTRVPADADKRNKKFAPRWPLLAMKLHGHCCCESFLHHCSLAPDDLKVYSQAAWPCCQFQGGLPWNPRKCHFPPTPRLTSRLGEQWSFASGQGLLRLQFHSRRRCHCRRPRQRPPFLHQRPLHAWVSLLRAHFSRHRDHCRRIRCRVRRSCLAATRSF
ncbi:hypothetical protein BKA81DRAFT_131407 [Phyllosticta paracitricarpa]